MSALDDNQWVVWAGVVTAVVTAAAAAAPKVRGILAPVGKWLSEFKVRRIQRQARIEAAAQALQDQRNRLLSVQLAGVAQQLESALRQSREDGERYANELAALRAELAENKAQLAAQTVEIAALRAELSEYRGERG
ncbi:hypothetical protein GS966_11320 [Rhodococcus hoagii]|nr:hypothetical protein [Prescottella equi]